MKKVLITDRVHPCLMNKLKKVGFHVNYQPDILQDQVIKMISEYHVLIINTKVTCDRHLMDIASSLEVIARLGSGLDGIDLNYARACNIKVVSSPEGNANAVAEHALGMLLALLNNICLSSHQVKTERGWIREPNRGRELKGQKIGILGFGNTGSSFAQKLQNWDVDVLTYDKYRSNISQKFSFVNQVGLDEMLAQIDVLSIHLPLNSETEYMVDKKLFKKCKPGLVVVNTARGKIINTSDLVKNLRSGHISGACLDVLENEKFDKLTIDERSAYDYLFHSPLCILTPHIAGWSTESFEKIASVLVEKVLNFYEV